MTRKFKKTDLTESAKLMSEEFKKKHRSVAAQAEDKSSNMGTIADKIDELANLFTKQVHSLGSEAGIILDVIIKIEPRVN